MTAQKENGHSDTTRRWRHKKRGTIYTEVCRAELQAATSPPIEGELMIVYRGDDGNVWVRGAGEFNDGRFEAVKEATAPDSTTVPDLGRIGALAEQLRCAGRAVTNDMVQTPGGDAYEYRGSTTNVDWLIEALNNLEHFQAGWVK